MATTGEEMSDEQQLKINMWKYYISQKIRSALSPYLTEIQMKEKLTDLILELEKTQ